MYQETREVEQDVQCLCHVGGMILVVVNGLRQVEVFSPNEEFDELPLVHRRQIVVQVAVLCIGKIV